MPSDLWKTPAGPNPLVLLLKHREQLAHSEQMVARIALETGNPAPASTAKLPGDSRALRGLPAIGYGIGGTMPGTQPEQETIAREQRRLKLHERTADR